MTQLAIAIAVSIVTSNSGLIGRKTCPCPLKNFSGFYFNQSAVFSPFITVHPVSMVPNFFLWVNLRQPSLWLVAFLTPQFSLVLLLL